MELKQIMKKNKELTFEEIELLRQRIYELGWEAFERATIEEWRKLSKKLTIK